MEFNTPDTVAEFRDMFAEGKVNLFQPLQGLFSEESSQHNIFFTSGASRAVRDPGDCRRSRPFSFLLWPGSFIGDMTGVSTVHILDLYINVQGADGEA